MVKNPNWQEVDQLATYKHDWGVELRATKTELDLNLGPTDFKYGTKLLSSAISPAFSIRSYTQQWVYPRKLRSLQLLSLTDHENFVSHVHVHIIHQNIFIL